MPTRHVTGDTVIAPGVRTVRSVTRTSDLSRPIRAAAPKRPVPTLRPHRRDIQGLRGLAVTLVVLGHAGLPWLAGGYVGVDVFFVISGFVITSGLLREAERNGSASLRRFYAARALRILPAASLVCVCTLVGCRLFASKIRYEEFLHDALAGGLYVMNVDLAVSGTDYLQEGGAPSPFQHLWSLSVEEQFYLLWPALLLVTWKAVRRPWLRVLPPAVLCLVSYVLSVRTTAVSPSWAYFGPHTRLWELGAGGLLALCAAAPARLPRSVAAAGSWLGLSAILASALVYDADTPFPGHAAGLPVLGALLVIAGGCRPSPSGASRLLGLRPATWVGDVSYGWYLWHWPLLVLVPAALNRTATLPLSLQVSAVALLPAWASLRLVENPVRFRTSLRDRPGAALGLGLGLTSGVVCFCLVAASFPPTISSGVRSPALAESLAAARDPGDRLARLVSTAGNRLPANLSPALPDVKKQRSAVYRDGCHVGYGATRSPDCVYGDPASREVVVLFGDSHAAQWFPALDRVSRDNGWKLVSLTKASCKTADITTRSGGSAYTSCDTWREEALRRITELRPMLVVAASSEAAEPVHRMSDPSREWTRGYERVYRRLARDAGAVAVLLDSPWPKGDAVECAARHPLRLGECEADQRDAIRSPTLRKAGETAARRAGAEVVDPRPWLCPPRGGCPTVVADTFVYRDESHVAESYARALAPVVREAFRKLGLA